VSCSSGKLETFGSVWIIGGWTALRRIASPLRRPDDTLDTLAGAKWFPTLAVMNAPLQDVMHSSDKDETAFYTGQGLWQFTAKSACTHTQVITLDKRFKSFSLHFIFLHFRRCLILKFYNN
jgi:hypothetical protein